MPQNIFFHIYDPYLIVLLVPKMTPKTQIDLPKDPPKPQNQGNMPQNIFSTVLTLLNLTTDSNYEFTYF